MDYATELGGPRPVSVHARHPADDVSRPAVDDAAVRRLRHGGGDQRALPSCSWRRDRPDSPSRSICRRRWASIPIRRGRPARSGGSASRSTRVDDMHTLLRRHPARPRVDVDDDQRHGRRRCSRCISSSPKSGGSPWTGVSGTIQNDILKEYVARGTYVYPPAPSLALVADVFRFCADQVPGWNPISISGYHIREAGATAVQELAFTFAQRHRVRAARAIAAGLAGRAVRAAPVVFLRLRTTTCSRKWPSSARRAASMRASCATGSAASDASCRLRFHTQTGGVTLTAQQPLNNVVRVAVQSLAATLGGTQSLHTNGYDEALALPTAEAATLALAHAADRGVRVGRREHRRSAGRELLRRAPDGGARDAGTGAPRARSMSWAARSRRSRPASSRRRSGGARTSTSLRVERGETRVVGVNCFADDAPPPVIADAGFLGTRSRSGRACPLQGARDAGRRSNRTRPRSAAVGRRRVRRRLGPRGRGTDGTHAADHRGGPRAGHGRRDRGHAGERVGALPPGASGCVDAYVTPALYRCGVDRSLWKRDCARLTSRKHAHLRISVPQRARFRSFLQKISDAVAVLAMSGLRAAGGAAHVRRRGPRVQRLRFLHHRLRQRRQERPAHGRGRGQREACASGGRWERGRSEAPGRVAARAPRPHRLPRPAVARRAAPSSSRPSSDVQAAAQQQSGSGDGPKPAGATGKSRTTKSE